jgi:hypothetical protein
MNGVVAALWFFFTTTCHRPEMARHLTLVRQPQKLPVLLTLEEVARLIGAAPGPKYKAALEVIPALRCTFLSGARSIQGDPVPFLHQECFPPEPAMLGAASRQ